MYNFFYTYNIFCSFFVIVLVMPSVSSIVIVIIVFVVVFVMHQYWVFVVFVNFFLNNLHYTLPQSWEYLFLLKYKIL